MKKLPIFLLSLFFVLPTVAEEEMTELGKHMDELSGLLKSIRKYEDDQWNEKAGVVREAQEALLKCFPLIPAMTEKVKDPEARALQVADYKRLLAENYALLCQYEIAFLKKDEDLADDLYRELKSIKKEGHTGYIEDN